MISAVSWGDAAFFGPINDLLGTGAAQAPPQSDFAVGDPTGDTVEFSQSGSVEHLSSVVTQFVQDAGLNPQSSQLLEALLAMLILVYLLQASQNDGGASQTLDMLGQLVQGASEGGGESSSWFYLEQTTMSLTSTTWLAEFGPTDDAQQPDGEGVDMLA